MVKHWQNILLSLGAAGLAYQLISHFGSWAFDQANWRILTDNWRGILIGRYPMGAEWRLWLVGGVIALGMVVVKVMPKIWWLNLLLVGLISGAIGWSQPGAWQGLWLSLGLTIAGLGGALPLGIGLAWGRQSSLPILKWLAIAVIELVRGVPLIALLFVGQVMLPLLLPLGWQLDRTLRAIITLSLFAAAYTAENLRGGLQSVPRSQYEAAAALGLSSFTTMTLVVLPQAWRAVLPALTNQTIGLLMDTALASQVGLLEMTGMARSLLAQPQAIGHYGEVYLGVALIYWLMAGTISHFSRRLEQQHRLNGEAPTASGEVTPKRSVDQGHGHRP
ncbi:MAG: amino acid ABC transporter permease [Pseudanabaenaceae cyanobacterium bins.68]|nr:amino acid ABC transporter permease [Pseudanabaenaceae cyanobacterium bins.68]